MSVPTYNETDHRRDDLGQFAPKDVSRDEAGQVVDLWTEDRGSFEFPPRPQTAEGLLHFWRNVEIPEAVARAVTQRQRIIQINHAQLEEREAERAYLESLGARQKPNDAELQEAKRAGYQRGLNEVNLFPQGYVYPAIRAAAIHRDSQYLPEHEREKVQDFRFRFPQGVTTAESVWTTFQFQNLTDEMANSESRSVQALESMAETLQRLERD